MASPALPAKHLAAGKEYLDAVRNLGLHPHFGGWGWETAHEQWLLVLVTPIVEAGGPLALNRLLFRAYNANATPKSISPFIVRAYSPDVISLPDFWMLGSKNLRIQEVGDKYGVPKKSPAEGVKIENVSLTFLGVEYHSINSYESSRPKRKPSYHLNREQWNLFKRNIEKLAA